MRESTPSVCNQAGQEQKRLLGEVAYAVFYYDNVSSFAPPDVILEAQQELRKLSEQLHATTLWAVPYYGLFESRGWVEKRRSLETATVGLVGWSNSVATKDSPNASRHRSRIIKALGLPPAGCFG